MLNLAENIMKPTETSKKIKFLENVSKNSSFWKKMQKFRSYWEILQKFQFFFEKKLQKVQILEGIAKISKFWLVFVASDLNEKKIFIRVEYKSRLKL